MSLCYSGSTLCATKEVKDKYKKFIEENSKIKSFYKLSDKKILDVIKNEFGFKDEFEFLRSEIFSNYINPYERQIALTEFKDRVTPTELINSDHIVKYFNRLENVVPEFRSHGWTCSEFESYNSNQNDFLCDVREYKGTDCAGGIINTCKWSEPGRHWYAIFLDFRGDFITIEYFNSQPRKYVWEMIEPWVNKKKDQLEKYFGKKCKVIRVNDFDHQLSDYQCGGYSLYFITCRVMGFSYKQFRERRIPDKDIQSFKERIFTVTK